MFANPVPYTFSPAEYSKHNSQQDFGRASSVATNKACVEQIIVPYLHRRQSVKNVGGVRLGSSLLVPFPSPSLFLSSVPSSPLLPSLEVGPKSSYGVSESAVSVSSPIGVSWGSKSNLVHFRLPAASDSKNFPENQLTKFS